MSNLRWPHSSKFTLDEAVSTQVFAIEKCSPSRHTLGDASASPRSARHLVRAYRAGNSSLVPRHDHTVICGIQLGEMAAVRCT